MESTELPGLEETFVAAFGHAPPYAEVPAGTPRSAMRQSLLATRRGGSGPIVQEACFVACGQLPGGARQVLGGLVVTLTPAGDLERFDDSVWTEPAPEDALVRRWGRPHLTWVFVHPDVSRHGVASRLLDQAVHALHRLGYKELASTFLLGNESSTLWHWKNGFSLKSYVLSPRLQNRG
jgi:GNAT superfamily N-acetyltransferase